MALHGTQFIVTLAPAPHLDGAMQIVGKVVSGLGSVRAMADFPSTDEDSIPLKEIRIGLCGVLGGGGLEGALSGAERALPLNKILNLLCKCRPYLR